MTVAVDLSLNSPAQLCSSFTWATEWGYDWMKDLLHSLAHKEHSLTEFCQTSSFVLPKWDETFSKSLLCVPRAMDQSVHQIHHSQVRLQDIVMSPLRTSFTQPYDYGNFAVDQGLVFKDMAKQNRNHAKMLYPS